MSKKGRPILVAQLTVLSQAQQWICLGESSKKRVAIDMLEQVGCTD
jgi:hypothetical protein